jgi:electron transfer flavoprotein alpha subunit
MNQEIIVIAELSDGRVLPVTQELIAFAGALAAGDSGPVRIMVLGRDLHPVACRLADETGMDVIALEGDSLEPYNAEMWIAALASRLAARNPRYVCIPHTSRGCDFAPVLAVRLGAACITAVEGIRRQDGVISFTSSIFNGKIRMYVAPETDRAVLTVLPGAFDAQDVSRKGSGSSPGHVQILKIPDRPQRIRARGVIPAAVPNLDLALADVIVSAGRGVGCEENLAWIRSLAGLFSKSAVGCSRALCDLGWLGYNHQIGLTGRIVAPKLYIACGISGAAQHIAGMRDSRFIVAVNKDSRAAIFQVADVGIVEDLNTFIPLVMEKAGDRP